MARSDKADRNRARHGHLARDDPARRAGAEISDMPSIEQRQQLAILQAVERHDVAHARALHVVIGLDRKIAGGAVRGEKDAHRAAAEVRHELGRHPHLPLRFVGERVLEQVDRLRHGQHALQGLETKRDRQEVPRSFQ